MEQSMPLGLRFAILHRSVKKQLDRRLQEKELTGVQFFVLKSLLRLEDGADEVRQRDLEEAAHLAHPTMAESVKRLEKQGFVVCRAAARDRRAKAIRSTDKAAALMREMQELDQAVSRELCGCLSERELGELIAITDKMLEQACACGKGSDRV